MLTILHCSAERRRRRTVERRVWLDYSANPSLLLSSPLLSCLLSTRTLALTLKRAHSLFAFTTRLPSTLHYSTNRTQAAASAAAFQCCERSRRGATRRTSQSSPTRPADRSTALHSTATLSSCRRLCARASTILHCTVRLSRLVSRRHKLFSLRRAHCGARAFECRRCWRHHFRRQVARTRRLYDWVSSPHKERLWLATWLQRSHQ